MTITKRPVRALDNGFALPYEEISHLGGLIGLAKKQ